VLTLALDTTSRTVSVALLHDDRLVVELFADTGKQHAETLLPAVGHVLDEAGYVTRDIDLFACTTGPGSFTGVRVGLSTVKGLARAFECSLVGVSSLEALAMNGILSRCLICPMLDARRSEVYTALYRPGPDGFLELVAEERAVKPVEFLETLEGDILFMGDGAEVYGATIRDVLKGRAHFAGALSNRVRASAVGRIGLKKSRGGDTLTPLEVMPRYLRASYAAREKPRMTSGR
jgi:tRNA threonylcarbamoyladenosine biosynthesis protein TsaB